LTNKHRNLPNKSNQFVKDSQTIGIPSFSCLLKIWRNTKSKNCLKNFSQKFKTEILETTTSRLSNHFRRLSASSNLSHFCNPMDILSIMMKEILQKNSKEI
jgi:hypothetical protein